MVVSPAPAICGGGWGGDGSLGQVQEPGSFKASPPHTRPAI